MMDMITVGLEAGFTERPLLFAAAARNHSAAKAAPRLSASRDGIPQRIDGQPEANLMGYTGCRRISSGWRHQCHPGRHRRCIQVCSRNCPEAFPRPAREVMVKGGNLRQEANRGG